MPVRIPLSVDQQQLLNDLIKQKESWGKIETAVKDYGKAANKEEAARLRQAKAIIRSQRSEQEVLADKIKVLRQVGAEDKTQRDESNRAIKRLIASERQRISAISDAAKKSSAAYTEEQRQIANGIKEVNRLKDATTTLDQKYDDLRDSIKAAFNDGKIDAIELTTAMSQLNTEQKNLKKNNPFAGGVGKLASYAAGVASVSAAINEVRKAFQLVQAEIDKGKSETERLERSRGNLAQISDETNFKSRTKTADDAAETFGIDRDQTMQALFDITSNRRLGETDQETKKSFQTAVEFDRVVPAEVAASFIGEFRKVFDSENMTARQSVNLGLSAAANSSFNIQQLQPQLRTAGQGSNLLPGATSSDVAAVTASIAALTGEQTGLAVRSVQSNLGAQLEKEKDAAIEAKAGFASATTLEDKQKFQAEFNDAAGNIKILSQDLIPILESLTQAENKGLKDAIIGGNKDLLKNFQTIVSQLGTIKKVDKNIESDVAKSGTAGDLLATKKSLLTSDSIINTEIEKKKSEISRAISSEKNFSERGNKVEINRNKLAESLNDQGASFAVRAAATSGQRISESVDFIREERPLTNFLKSIFGDGVDLKQRREASSANSGKMEKTLENIEKNTRKKQAQVSIVVEGV